MLTVYDFILIQVRDMKLLIVATVSFILVRIESFGILSTFQRPESRAYGVARAQTERSTCSMSMSDRIRSAVLRKQPNGDVDRVITCWDKFSSGSGIERFLDGPKNQVLQKADCFVEGLSAMPFHKTEAFPWALSLEAHYEEILQELRDSNLKQKAIQRKLMTAESEWLPPRDVSGGAYGPEWKTLGLQDRSLWDEDRILEFPRTVELLKEFNVPSCEVFFAKQGAFENLSTTEPVL